MKSQSVYREQLLRRRDEIAQLREVNREEVESVVGEPVPDWVDRSASEEEVDRLDALDEVERHELEEIDAALARMAEGRYGICAVCGEEIEPERLQALPETKVCLACGIEGARR